MNEQPPLEDDAEKPFLSKDQSDLLFWISFLILFTAIYAFIKRKYDISAICFIVFITSLNHWRDPQFGFRRNLDIAAVCLGFMYIFLRAILNNVRSLVFWTCYLAVVLLFGVGWHIYDMGYVWESTYSHCLLHLCGNVAVVLFCGI